MAVMAQLNVRMDPQLKSAGDAVLARFGVTPTQLIRALWMKVSRGAEALDQVVEAFAQEPAAVSVKESASFEKQASDPFEDKLIGFYQEYGLDYSAHFSPDEEEWEELYLKDRIERESERLVRHAQ